MNLLNVQQNGKRPKRQIAQMNVNTTLTNHRPKAKVARKVKGVQKAKGELKGNEAYVMRYTYLRERSDEKIQDEQRLRYGSNLEEAKKTCSKCDEPKLLNNFNRKRTNLDGLWTSCKA